MERLFQLPLADHGLASAKHPLWLVLHGAFARAEQALEIFGADAMERGVFLLAAQGTRPCGDGYCWSSARGAEAIYQLIEKT